MKPVPEVTGLDVAFGNIKHMSQYQDLPREFQDYHHQKPHCEFISHWFFNGLSQQDLDRLVLREGINKTKALAAINAIMKSFEPKHEHKIGACGFLLNEWFTVRG